jgi:hypothetical protein
VRARFGPDAFQSPDSECRSSRSTLAPGPFSNSVFSLGSDKSRGYCLETICADFLAGANLDNGDPATLLFSMTRFFKFLPGEQRQAFLGSLSEKAS